MANITNITPPRVPMVDPGTGMITREWYRFLLNLFTSAGSGKSSLTVEDLAVAPLISDLAVAPLISDLTVIGDLGTEPDKGLQSRPENEIFPAHDIGQLQSQIQDLALSPRYEPLVVTTNKFFAYQSTNQTLTAAAYTKITFPNVSFNINGGYSVAANAFYAPVAGYYQFTAGVFFSGAVADTKAIAVWVNNTNRIVLQYYDNLQQAVISGTTPPIYLLPGDYVDVRCYTGLGDTTLATADTTFFGGYRII